MALTVGNRLGHYNVTAEIGAGGTGEVDRADDTAFDRETYFVRRTDGESE